MEFYEKEIRERLAELVDWGEGTEKEILERWADGDTQNDFGNLDGSRFCNRYKAEQALAEAGFPWNSELLDILGELGYGLEIIERGPEVVDVIFCEVIAPRVAAEMLEDLK